MKTNPKMPKMSNRDEKAFTAVIITVPEEIKENMFVMNKTIGY